jgi:hypothetical protein
MTGNVSIPREGPGSACCLFLPAETGPNESVGLGKEGRPLRPRLMPAAWVQFESRVRFLARKRRPHCLQRFATKCSNSTRSFSVKTAFANWEMTFEQFLLVAAAIKPADLPATREDAATS